MSTILAVDDSAIMRKCLEITFAGTEMTLVTCDSAGAALEQVKMLGPDLVIADVSLPPSDGYDLCSTIKLAAPAVPVLMLSSKQHPFDPTKGAQADDHIDKPFDTQLLQDRARQLLEAGPTAVATPAAPPIAETQIGAPAPAAQRPAAPAERAAASPKIPAPRRRRPTPAMVPVVPAGPKGQPAGGGRRPVPFAMPSSVKKTAPGVAQPGAEPQRRGTGQPTMAFGSRPKVPPVTPGRGSQPGEPVLPAPTPQPAEAAVAPTPKPAVAAMAPEVIEDPPTPQPALAESPVQPVPAAQPTAAIPAEAAADLETKLTALGLTKPQVEGVLALSHEVLEQVVWEVVPTLAETMIKEEIARLTKE